MSTMYELERKFALDPIKRDIAQSTPKAKEDSYVVVDTQRKIKDLLRVQVDWNLISDKDKTI